MPTVNVKMVVRFSSQCDKHPCHNVLRDQLWLSSPKDTTRRLEAVFELDKPWRLTHIDIGLVWAATVKLEVGMSTWAQNEPYVVIFPDKVIMDKRACQEEKHTKYMLMLKPEDLCSVVRDQEWNRLKIVMTQPFERKKQFGVSSLKIKSISTEEDFKSPDRSTARGREETCGAQTPSTVDIQKHFFGESVQQNGSVREVRDRLLKINSSAEHGSEQAASLSRTALMVLHAAENTPCYKGKTPPTTASMRKSKVPFDKEVDRYLETLDFSKLDLDNMKYSDMRHEFERTKLRKLSKEEKAVFVDKVNVAVNNFLDRRENDNGQSAPSPAGSGTSSATFDTLEPQTLYYDSKSDSPVQSKGGISHQLKSATPIRSRGLVSATVASPARQTLGNSTTPDRPKAPPSATLASEVDHFLRTLDFSQLDLLNIKFSDLRREFEETKVRTLSKEERPIFRNRVTAALKNFHSNKDNGNQQSSPAPASSIVSTVSSATLKPQTLYNNTKPVSPVHTSNAAKGIGNQGNCTIPNTSQSPSSATVSSPAHLSVLNSSSISRTPNTGIPKTIATGLPYQNGAAAKTFRNRLTTSSSVVYGGMQSPTATKLARPLHPLGPGVIFNATATSSTPSRPGSAVERTSTSPPPVSILPLETKSADGMWLSKINPPSATSTPLSGGNRGRGKIKAARGRGSPMGTASTMAPRVVHDLSASSENDSPVEPKSRGKGKGKAKKKAKANAQLRDFSQDWSPVKPAHKLNELSQDWSPQKAVKKLDDFSQDYSLIKNNDIQCVGEVKQGKKGKKRMRANLAELRASLARSASDTDSSFEAPQMKKAKSNTISPVIIMDDDKNDSTTLKPLPDPCNTFATPEFTVRRSTRPNKGVHKCNMCKRLIKEGMMEFHRAICGVIDPDEDSTLETEELDNAYQERCIVSPPFDAGPPETTSCPMCYAKVPISEIEFHVNICLDAGS